LNWNPVVVFPVWPVCVVPVAPWTAGLGLQQPFGEIVTGELPV
jgi:hypothetical protein